MGDVKAKPSTRWPTPLSRQRPRLRNMRVEVKVDTLTDTVPGAKAKTPLHRLSVIKARALKDRIAENLAVSEAELLGDTSKYADGDTLVDTLKYNLVEVEVRQLGGILKDVKFEAIGIMHSR